ncbi:membrane protein containing DUF990, partial [mine drainage metagenome]
YEIGTGLLGGAIIPLSLFPSYFGNVLYALPFQFMFYIPITEFTGIGTINPQIFLVGLAWLAALIAIAYASWKFAFSKLTSAGG